MGIVRGKLEAPIDWAPGSMEVGDVSIKKCECGCDRFYDAKTGKEIKVEILTIEDLRKQEEGCKVKL